MTTSLSLLRQHLDTIVDKGLDAVSPERLLRTALEQPAARSFVAGGRVVVLAAGKAAAPMAAAFSRLLNVPIEGGIVACSHRSRDLPEALEWYQAGHPVPDEQSLKAGVRALAWAQTVGPEDRLIVLLSGGASAMLVAPQAGLSLAAKADATATLLAAGVPIADVNCVRKHLSAIKGGWLAALSRAPVLTLAISDVVASPENELSVIGSGPTVPDPTTFREALMVVEQDPVRRRWPGPAAEVLARGVRGELPETPKPGDPRLGHAQARVIGGRANALAGAREAAEALGYAVAVIEEPVVGDADAAARAHVQKVAALARHLPRPACILSAGETTVRVQGSGRGGRNQQFALAAAREIISLGAGVVLASIGTDGIDGPTDAAGALVDSATLERAARVALGAPEQFLDENDAYEFFEPLGDLIKTGPTDTNVGDLQVVLIGQ